MDKLKNNLASVAALIGVLGAIGTGFVKYGEVMTKLESMESADLKPIQKQISSSDTKIAVLENKSTRSKSAKCFGNRIVQ